MKERIFVIFSSAKQILTVLLASEGERRDAKRLVALIDAETFLLQSFGKTEHQNSWNIDFSYVVHRTKSYSPALEMLVKHSTHDATLAGTQKIKRNIIIE